MGRRHGASKGIGLGIAGALTEEGANVVLVARGQGRPWSPRRPRCARASADQAIVAKVADTSQRDSIAALFEALRVELPVLNVLVANAGSGTLMPFLDYTAAEWDRALALNLTGTFLCCQQAARRMIEAPVGSNRAIVVVSSIRADGVRPGLTGYAVTKAGVNQLVRAAAYELAPHGIRVNALSPGITATPLAQEDNPELFEERSKTVPMGRAGTPADMAAAALYLCSPSASFVTGANLVVDGGESLW